MKRILNIASVVITAKSLWWDKLSKEDQQRYISKAKGFLNAHKETLTVKGQQFVADKKAMMDEKKAATEKKVDEKVDAAEKAVDEKTADLNKDLEKEKAKDETPTPLLKDAPPIHTDGRLDVPTPNSVSAKTSDVGSPGHGSRF